MSMKTLAGISAAAILSILAGNAYADQMYVNKLNGTTVIPNATYGSITVGNAGIYATEYATQTMLTTTTGNSYGNIIQKPASDNDVHTHTVSGWFKLSSLPSDNNLQTVYMAMGHLGDHGGYKVAVDATGKLYVGKVNWSNGAGAWNGNQVVTTEGVIDTNWHYITISITKTSDARTASAVVTIDGATKAVTDTKFATNLNGGSGCIGLYIGAGVSAAGLYVDTEALDGTAADTIDKATNADCVTPVTREILDLQTITIDTETELDLSTITLPEDKDVMNIKVVVPAEKAITITGTKPAAVPGALQIEVNGEVTMTPALSATLGTVTGAGTLKLANADTGTSSSQHPTAAALSGFTGTVEISAGRIEAQSNFSHANMTVKVVDGAQLSAGNTGAWACKFNLSGDGWDNSGERNRYAITKAALRLNGNVTGAITVEGEGVAIGTYNSTLTLSGAITAANGLKVICEDGGNITLSAANNSIAGLDVVGAGTVTGGAANALGSGEITVRTGASVMTQQYGGNTGYSVTLDGGTLKSKGAIDAHGKLVKNLTLTKDSSYIWANEGAGSDIIGIGNGGAECSLALGGHTLTLTGKDANTRVYLDKTTITSAGTINVTQGKLFLHCSNIEMPAGSKLVIGESASIEADTVTLTVPELVYNGTATSASGDMCNVTVTDKYSGTGTIPKLTLADGATIEVAEVPEDKVVVKASNTLTANVETLHLTVGGVASELSLEKVNNTIVAREAGGTYDCTSVTSAQSETGCWYDGHNTDKWTINVPEFTGYLPNGAHIYATLNLGGNWTINDGYNGSTATIDKLTGEGNLTVSKDFGLAKRYTVIINDVSEYAGDISIGGTIVITLPNSYTETVTGAVAKKVGETMTDYYSTVDLALAGMNPGADVSNVTILDTDATLPAAWSAYKIVEGKIVAKTATELFLEEVEAANTGDTITLTDSVELTTQLEIAGKEITLDLNGQTISYAGAALNSGIILVHNGAGLTITGEGTIDSGIATVAVAVTKKGDDPTNPAKLTVNGGTLIGQNYGISGNGTRANTIVTINGGVIKAIKEGDGVGIYQPQAGTLTITGGTVQGTTFGVYAKSGTLAISGGTIKSTATSIVDPSVNNNGTNGKGYALVLEKLAPGEGGYADNLTCDITGGTFEGVTAILSWARTSSIRLTKFVADEVVLIEGEQTPSAADIKKSYKEGPTKIDEVTTDNVADVIPETVTTAETGALVEWIQKTSGITTVEGLKDINVNALIFNCSNESAPAVNDKNAEAAAADAILADLASKVDISKMAAGTLDADTLALLEKEYPMATIKLVPSTKLESTGTAKFFQLSIELK